MYPVECCDMAQGPGLSRMTRFAKNVGCQTPNGKQAQMDAAVRGVRGLCGRFKATTAKRYLKGIQAIAKLMRLDQPQPN